MDAFTTVLILLCVVFLIIYYWWQWRNYQKEKSKMVYWAGELNPCPDYWNHKEKGVCVNTFKIGKPGLEQCGTAGNYEINFASSNGPLKNVSAQAELVLDDEQKLADKMNTEDWRKAKCEWANSCNVTWEGMGNCR